MSEPLLNILERHAVCIKQGRAGMAQIVEADAAHTVVFEKLRERLRQMSGLDPLTQIVDVDIIAYFVYRLPQTGCRKRVSRKVR